MYKRQLRGYVAYRFESASDTNYTRNRLSVEELVYDDGVVLRALLGALKPVSYTHLSCCPGWVRFLKGQFPDYTDNLSTAKSPQQMFGALAKSCLLYTSRCV